jgi:hypothetical protein
MARPARVRMRRRKPWTLCRRRLFGWYVRLLTSFSFDGLQGMHRAQISGVPHRLAPLTHDGQGPCSWTCGTGRHQVVASLPTSSDRPTVRAGFRAGQTAADGPFASLWMKPCRRRCDLVTFAPTELPRHRFNTSITTRCDPPHSGPHTTADQRKQWPWQHACRPSGVTLRQTEGGFTACGQNCGLKRRARFRDQR